jgi:tetratricopeptide (TPR) repeat protein
MNTKAERKAKMKNRVRTLALVFAVALTLSLSLPLASCSETEAPLTAEELLDLGEKYLLELDYEQAIVCFERLIEIEPKNARAYTGLAEAYIGLGHTDKAREVLELGLEETDGAGAVKRALDRLNDVFVEEESLPDADETDPGRPTSETAPIPGAGTPAVDTPIESPTASPAPEQGASLVGKTPEFYVADYAGVLAKTTKEKIISSNADSNGLNALCNGAQIVVVTIKNLNGMYSDEYANALFNGWGVGDENANNGMLLLLVTEEKKAWLSIGTGISDAFTNSMVEDYLNEYFWTDFDSDNYDLAVNKLLEELFSWFAGYYRINSETVTDIFPDMTKAEHKTLHTFLSNFSELGMGDFDANNYTDDELISFAIWHTDRNSYNLIVSSDIEHYSGKISAERVESVVERYFGIRVKHKSVGYIDDPKHWNYGRYTYLYEGGYYYYMGADGEPLRWAQATMLIDNRDGTYTAYYDQYYSQVPPDNLYEDIADWHLQTQYGTIEVIKKGVVASGDSWDSVVYNASYIALVKPYNYNGNETYQLISLKPTA